MTELVSSKDFLDHVPREWRGDIANRFRDTVQRCLGKAGCIPTEVCSLISNDSAERAKQCASRPRHAHIARREIAICNAVIRHARLAEAFALHVIEYQSLPEAEREARRQQEMRGKRPTEEQMELLEKLGATHAPADRYEASRAIERMLAHKRGGHR